MMKLSGLHYVMLFVAGSFLIVILKNGDTLKTSVGLTEVFDKVRTIRVENGSGGRKLRRNLSHPPEQEVFDDMNVEREFRVLQIRHSFLGSGYVSDLVMSQNRHVAQGLLHGLMTDVVFNCSEQIHVGNPGDGGYDICTLKQFELEKNNCLVYSFGINNDFGFDDMTDELYGCEVHSFDPSMGKEDHMHREPNMYFHNLGLWGWDMIHPEQNWQMKSISSIIKMLGHENRTLDILKVDVEGAEWQFMVEFLESGVYKRVRQLLLEFHVPRQNYQTYPPLSVVDYAEMFDTIENLRKHGFHSFMYHNVNPYCCYFSPAILIPASIAGEDKCCYEQNFVNLKFSQ